MSSVKESDGAKVGRLVEAALRTIAGSRYCWLSTVDESGLSRLRPMGRLQPEPGDDAWTLRFVTDGRSAKAADIRRAKKVALVFQREDEDAFVGFVGRPRLEEDKGAVRRRWRRAYDAFFPSEADKASAVFFTVEAERLDLWIRGVTPEPFGLKTTTLVREAEGWRLAAGP